MWRLLLGTMGVKSLVQGLIAAATAGFEPRTVWSEVLCRYQLATAPPILKHFWDFLKLLTFFPLPCCLPCIFIPPLPNDHLALSLSLSLSLSFSLSFSLSLFLSLSISLSLSRTHTHTHTVCMHVCMMCSCVWDLSFLAFTLELVRPEETSLAAKLSAALDSLSICLPFSVMHDKHAFHYARFSSPCFSST